MTEIRTTYSVELAEASVEDALDKYCKAMVEQRKLSTFVYNLGLEICRDVLALEESVCVEGGKASFSPGSWRHESVAWGEDGEDGEAQVKWWESAKVEIHVEGI